MLLSEIMTRRVGDIAPQATLTEAAQKMRAMDVGALPVREGNQLIGIVTDRDLALALGEVPDAGHITLDRVMSRHVHTCRPDDDLAMALERMAAHRVRRLPVVDDAGDVKGLVSIDDIVLWGLESSGVSTHGLVVALRALCAASSFAAREYADHIQPS